MHLQVPVTVNPFSLAPLRCKASAAALELNGPHSDPPMLKHGRISRASQFLR